MAAISKANYISKIEGVVLSDYPDCNEYAQEVMSDYGYPLPTGTCSSMLDDLLNNGFPPYYSVSWSEAQDRANNGYPTIAITYDHVACVRPTDDDVTSIKEVHLAQTGATKSYDMTLNLAWKADRHNEIRFYSYY